MLQELISYIEGGTYCKSEPIKFIAQNFRLSIKMITERYNDISVGEECTEETTRSRISKISNALYKIFPTNLDDVFILQDPRGLSYIEDALDMLTGFDRFANELFISEVLDETIPFKKNYEVDELKKEIELLAPYLKRNVFKSLDGVDLDKMSYLIYQLKQPFCFAGNKGANIQKIELLRELENYKQRSNNPIIHKQEENDYNYMIQKYRRIADMGNDYEDSEENRDYLRRVFAAAKQNSYFIQICKNKKISSHDIKTVLNEIDSATI